VFDAFALLAFYLGQPAAYRVRELLNDARAGQCQIFLTSVNLGEVIYGLVIRRDMALARRARSRIKLDPITVVDADENLALIAAGLKAIYRAPYADSFVAALALRLGATAVTGDADFRKLESVVAVEWLPT
jgi:predicted nucleic acid-binding protein